MIMLGGIIDMAEIWDNTIDKHTDWGGDSTTNGLPVSGRKVQEFIKSALENKMGTIYYDASNNRYLVFADEENRDLYLADPIAGAQYVMGTFDAPFNFSAEINLITPIYNAVFLNSVGNYLTFTFDIKNKQGASTGEDVMVTYTIMRNSVRQTFSETKKFGDTVNFNIDKYLNEGVNSITIGVKGLVSFAATTVNVTYQVVNLQLTDELDITKVYRIKETPQDMEIPFTVSGYGTKIIEWYLDGELLPHDRITDEAVDVSASRVKYIRLADLCHGIHTIQFRAYTIINGERFYSDTLYREIFISTTTDKSVMIGISGRIPQRHGIIASGDSFQIFDMQQFVPYSIVFATYSPSSIANIEVEVNLNGETISRVNSNNDVVNKVTIVPTTSGDALLKLIAGDVQVQIPTVIKRTDMDIQEIVSGLEMDFTSRGKTNNSADRDSWSQGDFSATFTGFKWNNTSGWVNDRLLVSEEAVFEMNYAPLSGDVTNSGKTIELEFMTTGVKKDDTVICDLRNEAGVGLLITATQISITSENGVVVQTRFNSEENVRLAFVINRKSGTTNKMLTFLYANGILSAARNWIDTDSYTSDKVIKFVGSPNAQVSIKQIRVYNEALSSDQILNNYILYRDSVDSMLEVYHRNDIYLPNTNIFSPEKMASRCPVMIVTGNIPVLENTGNKDTQIIVDIEYINMQDPTRSFKMVNAAMRPQGTSSMSYPKKNFRIYTQKVDSTIVYDYLGEPIADKLYSFKPNAQPVNCWCLKADYAESSGTHNTGIARLWNQVLFDTQLEVEGTNDRFPLRTNAQKSALANNYEYDVRTTVDGFPILLFYRMSPQDDLIFIGKYNFNNDKSTESVFGFENIPGFDNSRMQCWEVRDNGHPLGLFTDVSNFDTQWDEAWESRYPDTKTPTSTLADLKAFSIWMAGINGDHARFKTEKWERFDVYKMAAYYCYLMRFGAVDQVVKNVFLTSEDGVHYYIINYDNDTIMGLLNSGQLEGEPTIDRNTTTEAGEYVYAGRNSVMWNMFEADEEFMALVPKVDNALSTHGLSYDAVIDLFDNRHANYWVERVYNQDAQYKYIGPFTENIANNLFMLQGKRDLHRKWWLAKRFSIYDAKWVSGSYRAFSIDLKLLNDTPPNQKIRIVAGDDLSYGYGLNSALREIGVELLENEEYTFTTTDTLNRGDVVKLFGAPHIKELDLSEIASVLLDIQLRGAVSPALGTKLERLIIGKIGANNLTLESIGGLAQCVNLKEINIEGIKSLTSLDLRGLPNLEVVKALDSNVASIAIEKGAPINRLELPEVTNTLILEQLPYLTTSNLIHGNSIRNVTIKGSPNLSNDFSFAYDWNRLNTHPRNTRSFEMDNVNWTGVSSAQLLDFLQLKVDGGELVLKGVIYLTSIDVNTVNALINILGENIFNVDGELRIIAPDFIGFRETPDILEGETVELDLIVISEHIGVTTYAFSSATRAGTTINPSTGVITTTENGEDSLTVTVRAIHTTTEGYDLTAETSFTIKKRVYPIESESFLVGSNTIDNILTEYRWESNTPNITGDYIVEWVLGGPAFEQGYLSINSSDNSKCVIRRIETAMEDIPAYLSMTMTKRVNGDVVMSLIKDIVLPNYVAVHKSLNPILMNIIYEAGLSADADFLTMTEARALTATDIEGVFAGTNIETFYELEYFTGLLEIPIHCFKDCSSLTGLKIPTTVTTLKSEAFFGCSALATLDIPTSVSSIELGCFRDCIALDDILCPPNITSLDDTTFFGCSNLKTIMLPTNLTSLGISCFGNCTSLEVITLPSSLSFIDEHCFSGCTSLSNIRSHPITAPTVKSSTFGTTANNYTGKNKSGNILLIPLNATGYDASSWLDPLCNASKGKFTIKEAYTATECTNLIITADNVAATDTTTTIYWIATTNGINDLTGEVITGVKYTGTATSAPFPQNEDEENAVSRTVSFTYMNKTASVTIQQAAYIPEPVLATDADFSGTADGNFVYIGSEKHIIIPHKIKGVTVTKTNRMFGSGASIVRSVATLEGHSITDMSYMFYDSKATTLDLSSFDTSNVTNMTDMFRGSKATTLDLSNFNTSKVTTMAGMFYLSSATTLDLSSFNTSKVTNMKEMFRGSLATTLDLSSFDTSKVTDMGYMFVSSKAPTLDLSSFDTSKVTNMKYMFSGAQTTTGYARTQADADKFNASSNKPAGLIFVVK